MRVSRTHLVLGRTKAITQMICGIIIFLFFGMGIIGFVQLCCTDGSENLVPLLLCLGLTVVGGWLIAKGRKQSRLVRSCGRYADILSDRKSISLREIGDIVGKDHDTVQKTLEQMIHRGYLEQVYIDLGRDLVVCLDENGTHIQPAKPADFAPQMVAVTCQACGGITMLPVHSAGVCDYCGSQIQG